MASFRNGIKILSEFSIKQGLGRIRSFSEDRKPGRWLPEDQWAVRQPGSTCPDPCKPKKPPKASKSWLSLCKDPEPPITCDIRHNNCPSPPPPKEGPWYSLDNLIPKKKSEKPPPLYSCQEERKRREAEGEEEVCERRLPELKINTDNEDICCMPKPDPSPAPVMTMSCPLPKELDIMLWCGRPSTDRTRIANLCQSDKLPYEEFRPQKCWKPLPFSLPCKSDSIPAPSIIKGSVAYSEFKQVEVPRPLYTRYKSVELGDFLLSMVEVKCPDDKESSCLPTTTSTSVSCYPPTSPPPCSSTIPPCRRPCLPPCCRTRSQPEQEKPNQVSCERRVIEAASCKPVKIKKATKYTFRPKPTKLVERRILKNPFASCKNSNAEFRMENEESDSNQKLWTKDEEPPKVLTGTLTKEPQIYERDFCANNPPRWMYVLCKPGCKETPLIPKCDRLPDEPDWSSETDGLKFYGDENGNITPKPPEDPCKCVEVKAKPVVCEPQIVKEKPAIKVKNRLVLMPEYYNIKFSRPEDPCVVNNECESASFDEFIEAKTSSSKKCSKSNPQMKENILYDLQRLCPGAPLDPTKLNPCRKPVEDPCAPRFFRCYSTVSSKPRNLNSVQLVQTRTECGDSSGKCKPKIPQYKTVCPEEKPKPACAQAALPCCRKAVVPPNCQVRKPMPVCRKKPPPKPSFSECARDPPPCPKMTECNAWDRRLREDSKRKYSDWAFLRTEFNLRQATEGKIPQKFKKTFAKSIESQAREVYANTVKCRTIKPKHDALGSPKDRIVLGLNDDPACDYEQRNIFVKQTKSNRIVPKDDQFFLKENVDVQMIGSMIPDVDLKNGDFSKSEDIEESENFVPPSDNPEEDKEISRDLMGSIGSWINEFFNVPTKRPVTVPQTVKPNRKPGPENMKLGTEYLKSFNDFKEQMKKKLKTETTVHLSPGDKSVEFNFDKLTDKKSKKKSSWLSPLECNKTVNGSKKKTEMIPHNTNSPVHRFPIKINDKENIYVAISPEDRTDVKESILIKENLLKKERSKNGKLEEYFFVTPLELSKSLLLNINDHEKCSQLYNNTHARIQEPQPYQLRRTNSYQRNARCYTTNANLVENSKSNSLMSNNKKTKRSAFYTSDSTTTCTADECSSPKKKMTLKKKAISELLGDESSFDKIRSTKSLNISFLESSKINESKPSSEELVKHLIKKTKVTGRPQPFKKKPKGLLAEGNPKSRFLQSATTSLVVNVLAKKENLLSLRAGSRLMPEGKNLKLDRELKEWPTKQRDKYEIKKLASPKFNKSSYLSDISDKPESQNDSAGLRPFGRQNELEFLSPGRDMREKNGKNKKGEDIKCILSKIDGRYDKLRAQQKLKKTEEKNEQCETQEAQNARFQKQHELFKKLPKSAEQTESSEENELECKIEEKCDSSITTPSPSEIIVLNTEIQSLSKIPKESENYELKMIEKTQSLPLLSDNFESAKSEVLDRMYINEKPLSPKAEKNEAPDFKNKLVKTKSLQYLKEDDMRTLINSATELPNEESQKQISKAYERQLSPTEIRPQKSLEPVLLNRSYSTTMLMKNQKPTKLISLGHPKNVVAFSDDKKDCDKKSVKDKKTEKNEKPPTTREMMEHCDFTPVKKPGPNCENPDYKP